ncbi:MAG: peptide-methionine (S)-S-oxide reductase, partial [Pseudomonadota bacterium]|nr:peptide-methionine (S)-S-oxide reductase [Pseudomonadota bacterium]
MTRTSFALRSAPRRSALFAGLAAVLAIGAFAPRPASAAESAVKIAPPALDTTTSASGTQTAVFAGGCFWGVQGVFQRVGGVVQAVSGYAGGAKETAQYEMVGSGLTGHAESV